MKGGVRATCALVLAGLVPSACATAPTVAPAASSAAPAPAPSAAASSPVPKCDATQSYTPSTTSPYAATIRSRGYLVAGVSSDTRLLGSVVPNDPKTFEGFDIDMVRRVAAALWPGETDIDARIRFKVISAAQRIPQLTTAVNTADIAKGGVDLVARAFTMTCARWQSIAFSGVYFKATQKLLVASDSTVTGVAELPKGSKVCAPKGSTSLDALDAYPNVVKVGVDNHTDCLALFQQGAVTAITGDDAILAGFRSQDAFGAKVLAPAFGDPQPYGLGINLQHKDFAAFVNSVLESMRADGSWQKLYNTWFQVPLKATASQPPANYGRT
jgi:polar amino acid transport system substrate-binding protein